MRCKEKTRIVEILRLWEMGLSQREIANSVKCGKTTVGEIQHRCMHVGLTYDQASHICCFILTRFTVSECTPPQLYQQYKHFP